MRLVYKDSGFEVKVGDKVFIDGQEFTVVSFAKPHKPESQGKATVQRCGVGYTSEYYVSVLGAVWVEREDRES